MAQFFFADEDLNSVAAELDSFDGRKDPERCTILVNQLRMCQDKVLTVIQKMMLDAIPGQRANRDFRVKFPDDVLQESLAGQLWFGAEVSILISLSILTRKFYHYNKFSEVDKYLYEFTSTAVQFNSLETVLRLS